MCRGDKGKLCLSRELNSGYLQSSQEDILHVFQVPFPSSLNPFVTATWNLARASSCKKNGPNYKKSKSFQSQV